MSTAIDKRVLDVASLNSMSREEFVAAVGSTFEHSPWVAEQAWEARPFGSVDDLHAAMIGVVRRAPHPVQLSFLCAHPELAGREAQAGTMTDDSVREQRSAGLDALSKDEVAEIKRLNGEYRRAHGTEQIPAAALLATAVSFIGGQAQRIDEAGERRQREAGNQNKADLQHMRAV